VWAKVAIYQQNTDQLFINKELLMVRKDSRSFGFTTETPGTDKKHISGLCFSDWHSHYSSREETNILIIGIS